MSLRQLFRLFATLALCTLAGQLPAGGQLPAERPNLMIILADDLGFSDLGCYGGEIETPNLDRLAANGLRFTSFYNSARCWPSRGSILTGYYPQQIRRDKLPGVSPSGVPGKRPAWAPLAPVYLREAAYRSYHTGKWHIDSTPVAAGFDHSYFLADQARFFSPQRRFLNDRPLPAIERGSGYYATTDLADQAIAVLKEHAANHRDQPFFHYLALTAPHFPLHALPEDIARYREIYRAGWDRIRQQRWQRVKHEGLVNGDLSAVEFQTGAPYKRPADVEAFGPGEVALPIAWDELNPEQQEFQATKMAIHAAMVDRIDQELGRVFQQLREMGEFDNTLILFLSDNGCSSELMIRDDGHDPQAVPGSADTHLCLGPGWATVSNTPFRKHKTWVHEGGIATPLIAHWPAGLADTGQLRHQVTHLIDILPTMMELAGLPLVPRTPGAPRHPGHSLLSVLKTDQPLDRDFLWCSHENNQAIRSGGWKAVRTSDTDWQLFDMRGDRTETSDLADRRPSQVDHLVQQWQQIRKQFTKDAAVND
jgi:arylsulfatase